MNDAVRDGWSARCAAAEPTLLRRADLDLATPWEEPQPEVELKLADIWRKALNLDAVGASDDFFELGGDSLAATVLAAEVEATFGVRFSPADIMNFSTISDQALTIAATRQLPPNLIAGSLGGTLPPFFMVHGAWGFAFFSRGFIDVVGQDRPVYLFQAPGLDGRMEPLGSIEEIADAYIASMRKIQPTGPYYIGGMCAGAFITLEMCIQLKKAGQPVGHLILLDPYPWPRALARSYRRGWALRHIKNKLISSLRLSSPGRWMLTYFGSRTWAPDSIFEDELEKSIRLRTEQHQRMLQIIRHRGEADEASPEERSYSPETMLKAATQLREAFKRYVPRPYSGKASMLVSSNRARETLGQPSFWLTHLAGIDYKVASNSSHRSVFREQIVETAQFVRNVLISSA